MWYKSHFKISLREKVYHSNYIIICAWISCHCMIHCKKGNDNWRLNPLFMNMHCCTRKLFKHFDMQACPTCLNMESLDFTAAYSFTACLQARARRWLVETTRQESLFACTDCKVKHRQLAENVADSSDAEHSVTLFHIVLVQAAQSGSSPTRTQQAGSSYKSRDTWGIHSTWVDWFHHRPLKVRFWTM